MLETILIEAALPLAPSINHLYKTVSSGRRVLSEEGRIFRQTVLSYLDLGRADAPYVVILNHQAIEAIRASYLTHRTQATKTAPWFGLSMLHIFSDRRRDVDGGNKIMQDVLIDWLAMRYEGGLYLPLTDQRILEQSSRKYICPHHPPMTCICLYLCRPESGTTLPEWTRILLQEQDNG